MRFLAGIAVIACAGTLAAGLRLALAARASSLAQGQQPTFRTGTGIVSLGVTVSDKKANFLTDLTRDDLEIFEDGKKQTIEYFARGDQDAAPELHIGLLFDTSGSMDADIKLSRSAAVKFLNTLSDAKDITLVDFDTEVRVAKYGQLDFPRLVERIRARKPSGFTAMYDALGVYLDSAAEQHGPEDSRAVHRRRRHAQHDSIRRRAHAGARVGRDRLLRRVPRESAGQRARRAAAAPDAARRRERRRGLLPVPR